MSIRQQKYQKIKSFRTTTSHSLVLIPVPVLRFYTASQVR